MGAPSVKMVDKEEYVKNRFENIPPEMSNFLNLTENEDALVHLESIFRAEWVSYMASCVAEYFSGYYGRYHVAIQVAAKYSPSVSISDIEQEVDELEKELDGDKGGQG